jgi:hypothetical protein
MTQFVEYYPALPIADFSRCEAKIDDGERDITARDPALTFLGHIALL